MLAIPRGEVTNLDQPGGTSHVDCSEAPGVNAAGTAAGFSMITYDAADRNPLTAAVECPADGGHSWFTPGTTSTSKLVIAKAPPVDSRNTRIRFVVSDGMRENIAMSGKFKVVGAPPRSCVPHRSRH